MAAPAFAMKADKLMCLIGDEDTVTGFLLAGIGEVDASKNSNFLVVTQVIRARVHVVSDSAATGSAA